MKKKKISRLKNLIIMSAVAVTIICGNLVFADENSCLYCGMKKDMFGHSWVNIVREDGSVPTFNPGGRKARPCET